MSFVEKLGRAADLAGHAKVDPSVLREAVDSLDQIVFLAAVDLSQVFYMSPAYERVTGYRCETLYKNPQTWADCIYEGDRDLVLGLVAKRVSGEISGRGELEFRIRTADGEVRWLRAWVTPLAGGAEQCNRIVGFAEDITARKQAEWAVKEKQAELAQKVEMRSVELSQTVTRLQQEIEQRKGVEAELRRSETRFRQLFEANIIGVTFTDIYGNISDANGAFLEMTGYARSDLPLRWDKMTPPEWSHTNELALQQLVREGSVKPWEKEYIRKDGTRVPVLIGGYLLDRDTWRSVFFVLDLTKSKNAEEQVREVNLQLEHASRLSVMGELLADMAHEIHQPLGVIANYANGSLRRLKKGQLTVGALKDRLREIAAESMRVAQVLRRIREFIRRREPERHLVSLNLIVMDALQLTRLERREHRVAVIFRPDGDLPRVQADRVQITQVLVNLLLNAIHAVSAADQGLAKILIATYLNDAGFAELSLADNGPGIDAADLPHIFDRFFTTKSSGLGLGLPISRSIIESHGGQLWYDSAPNEPAVFRLTLPVHKMSVDAST